MRVGADVSARFSAGFGAGLVAFALASALTAGGLLVACNAGPVPIAYGTDQCATCHMGITDPRFGSEAVSTTGKVWKFDSAEDLAADELLRGRDHPGERGIPIPGEPQVARVRERRAPHSPRAPGQLERARQLPVPAGVLERGPVPDQSVHHPRDQ